MVPVGIYIFWVRDRDQGLPARRDQGLLLSVAPHTVEQPRGTMTNTLSRWETAGTQQTHAPLEPVSPPHSVQVLCKGHIQLEESLNSGSSSAVVCYRVYFVLSTRS